MEYTLILGGWAEFVDSLIRTRELSYDLLPSYYRIPDLFGIAAPVLNEMGLLSDTTLNLWGRYFCFAIAALGIDLIWGYTGILSLCQAFFFCLGGYAIGMHMLLKTGTQGVYGSALPDFMVWNRVEQLPHLLGAFSHFYICVYSGAYDSGDYCAHFWVPRFSQPAPGGLFCHYYAGACPGRLAYLFAE